MTIQSWLENETISSLQQKLSSGELTSVQLVKAYLERIATYNPKINAILEINPDALFLAEAFDHERIEKGTRSDLHGIPVIVKDNMNTADGLHTSAGSLALSGHIAQYDAKVVEKLREAGAIILGKANMTEWANFMSDRMTNGYSSRGGQVKNPFGAFDVGGSSSGSAAGIAASFAAGALGTETSGSILTPSAQNGLVGLKPTVGAVSRAGIIPLAHSQDIAGPMTKTVEDAFLLFRAIVGKDSMDPSTYRANQLAEELEQLTLSKESLNGKRLGVVPSIYENELSTEAKQKFEEHLNGIRQLGATIIELDSIGCMEDDLNYDVLTYEFKADVNRYLQQTHPSNPIRSLQDVIRFNQEHANETLKFGQVMLEQSDRTSGTLTDPEYIQALLHNQEKAASIALGRTMDEHQLDAYVFPQDKGCGIGAAAGFPSITIPVAQKETGEPIGVTFSSRAYTEPLLLQMGYALEQHTKSRPIPTLDSYIEEEVEK